MKNLKHQLKAAGFAVTASAEESIIQFFHKNPNPSDDQIHELAKSLNQDKHMFEESIYALLTICLKKLDAAREVLEKPISPDTSAKDGYYEEVAELLGDKVSDALEALR